MVIRPGVFRGIDSFSDVSYNEESVSTDLLAPKNPGAITLAWSKLPEKTPFCDDYVALSAK